MKGRKLRIGMVGAGGISAVHCKGWSTLVDCDLVAITDINKESAAKRAAEYKFASVEATTADLLKRDDIDIVDIVTPNMFHKEQSIAAMEAGKHVLCEKPLALSAKDVDAMIAASVKFKKKLMCAQHMRFQADSRAMKEYLLKRPLGNVYYARAWYNRRRFLPCTPGFMYKKNAGGGCCIDVGVHILDLALHMMDNFEPISVTGVAQTMLASRGDAWSEWGTIDKKNIDVEDFAAGMVRFANGAVLSLECSFMLNMKLKNDVRLDLFGTDAGATWPSCEYFDHTSSDYVDVKIDVRDTKCFPHGEEIVAFANSVVNDTPVPVPPQQTRAVIAILEGLYKSQRTGKEVRLA